MRRIALALFLMLTLLVGLSTSASASNHNCGDYISQEAAQSVYLADTSDPKGLDRDDDGVACEDYDYASNPGTNPGLLGDGDPGELPENGVAEELPATGTGSAAVSSSGMSVLGALAVLLLIAGSIVRRTASFRA